MGVKVKELWNNCKAEYQAMRSMNMDMEQARFNMVEQQIRPWDVLDANVLALLFQVRREDFVPVDWKMLAFADMEIPLGHDAAMLSPKFEARILQEMHIRDGARILEIGTGSGYLTALLARSAGSGSVTSVDIVPEFTAAAAAKLAQLGIANVTLETGDAAQGWNDVDSYDYVIITGSLPMLPAGFTETLKVGAQMFAVVGDCPVMEAQLIQRLTPEHVHAANLFETCVPALKNAQQPQRFKF